MKLFNAALFLSLCPAHSSFLRSTESSSADPSTESSSADAPLPTARPRFDSDEEWAHHLQANLNDAQLASFTSSRKLQDMIWMESTWDNPPPPPPPNSFELASPVNSIDLASVELSDFPSMTPSDFPSMAPSDMPSLAPSLSTGDEDIAGRSFTFMDAAPTETLNKIVMDKFELNWFKIMLDKGEMNYVLDEKEGITVLAPVNEAFQALERRLLGKLLLPEYALHVRDIVRYHLLWWQFTSEGLVVGRHINTMEQDGVLGVILGDDGEIQLTSEAGSPASFIDTDISGSNGELHIIDQVLLPKFVEADAMTILEDSIENMSLLFQTISHDKFLAMVRAAGLDEMIRGLEEATVFLPDDDGIDNEIFDYLMTPGNDDILKAVVEYHLVPFALNFELFQFMVPATFSTVQGEAATITRRVGLVVDDILTISLTLMKCGHVYHTNGLLLPPSLKDQIVAGGNTTI